MEQANIPLLALLVAILMAVMALVTLVRNRRATERHDREALAQRELVQFRVTANRERLMIRNIGNATAYNVQLSLEPLDGGRSPIDNDELQEKIPIRVSAPLSETALLLAQDITTSSTFIIRLHWQNKDKSTDTFETQVTTLEEL